MTAYMPRFIPYATSNNDYSRPVAPPLRPVSRTPWIAPNLFTPVLQTTARLQPHHFQAPVYQAPYSPPRYTLPPPSYSYTLTPPHFNNVPPIPNFTPNYGVTIVQPVTIPPAPLQISPHTASVHQRITSVYERIGMQPPPEITIPSSPARSSSRSSISPSPRNSGPPPVSPRTSASIERQYRRLESARSTSRESSLERNASSIHSTSTRRINREPQTLSRANTSASSFHATPMRSNGSRVISTPTPIITTRQPSPAPQSRSTSPVFAPAPRVISPSPTISPRQVPARNLSPESNLEENLQVVEQRMESPIENIQSCSILERALAACHDMVARFGLFQFTERLADSGQLLTGIKQSLTETQTLSPSPSPVNSSRAQSPFTPVTETIEEATEASPSIGSITIPSTIDLSQARINRSHLDYPIRDLQVPDSPMTFDQAARQAKDKAHELNIELGNPRTAPQCFRAKLDLQSHYPNWKTKTVSMFKRIAHILFYNEQEAQRTGNRPLQEKVDEKWYSYLTAFQAGSGDCNDPMTTQIENCYNDLFSVAPSSFEDKIQIAARDLRDETFDRSCSDYMRNCRSQHMDQASGLPFFKKKLQATLGLTSKANTHYEDFCTQCGYDRHTNRIKAKFNEEYTPQKLVEYLCGTESDGKNRVSHEEIVDFLKEKTGVDKDTIEGQIAGLDEDLMPTGNIVSKESLLMMVLQNLDKPMIA
ncbi:MAG: hypothetical protein ACI9S8_002159 [Chlamydiales bacterium]|jgi:hypothetical protein